MKCTFCEKDLPETEFWKDQKWCKVCLTNYRKTKCTIPINRQIKKQEERLESMKVNHLSIEDAAYIAGFLDGEGAICLTRNHRGLNSGNRTPSYHLRIEICNNCLDVLNWILCVVGYGNIYRKNKGTSYGYTLLSSRTSDFLNQLLPYLKIKKMQAEVAIQYSKTMIHQPGGVRKRLSKEVVEERECLRNKILTLNSRYRSGSTAILS